MSEGEKYFTFPLSVLHGIKPDSDPYHCIDLALDCGMVNAAIGFRKNASAEDFQDRLDAIIEKKEIKWRVKPDSYAAHFLVGSNICGVSLGGTSNSCFDAMTDKVSKVMTGGPLVKMAGKYFWPAFYQAKAESDPSHEWPERGISWREFRILCAILSSKINRAGFTFISWEGIQARSCGYTTKAQMRDAEEIPDHLAPPLSRKQIRATCDALEDLGFFARFRFSTGKVGGLTAYSFRHSREELAKAVCDSVNFRDRAKIKANREEDAKKCLELLERAKVGPSKCQQGGQG